VLMLAMIPIEIGIVGGCVDDGHVWRCFVALFQGYDGHDGAGILPMGVHQVADPITGRQAGRQGVKGVQ
jgi:hypothetical protein